MKPTHFCCVCEYCNIIIQQILGEFVFSLSNQNSSFPSSGSKQAAYCSSNLRGSSMVLLFWERGFSRDNGIAGPGKYFCDESSK